MESNNPLLAFTSIILDWDSNYTYWSDEFFATQDERKRDRKGHDDYIKRKVDESFIKVVDKVSMQLHRTATVIDRINLLKGIFYQLSGFIMQYDVEGNNCAMWSYAIEKLKELDKELHSQYDEVLHELINCADITEESKLKINLNRTEISHFILLLIDIGIISDHYTENYIAKLLEKNLRYRPDNSKSYLPLKGIAKYFDKIRNGDQYSHDSISDLQLKIGEGKITVK